MKCLMLHRITSSLYVLITLSLHCLLRPAVSSRLLLAGLDLTQSLEPVQDILPGALCPDHYLKVISSTCKRNPSQMFMLPAKYLQVICLYNLSPSFSSDVGIFSCLFLFDKYSFFSFQCSSSLQSNFLSSS